MDERCDHASGTGKIGEPTLIAAVDMGSERGADGTEGGSLGRSCDDGEFVGVGAFLLKVEPAELREKGGERHETLLHDAR